MADVHPHPIRVFHLTDIPPSAPFSIGKKGASWYLVYSRPFGMRKNRIHACINVDAYLEQETPDGNPQFRFNDGPGNSDILEQLLAVEAPPIIKCPGSQTSGRPGAELLVPHTDVLQCCSSCDKWETVGRTRFERCSACRLQY
ncbi:hypothetical protein C8R44DRAFT_335169 [Mycena epipterygia]|nr:hypothetical protein C8R44DRAFT_335169 [Mycena epipterygia]